MVVVSCDKIIQVSGVSVKIISSDMGDPVSGDVDVVYKIHNPLLGSFKVITAVVGVSDFNQMFLLIGVGVGYGGDCELLLLITVLGSFDDRL